MYICLNVEIRIATFVDLRYPRAMRIAIVNLKGGTGKTTTSVFLAAVLNEQGPTLLIDADPQGSALSWSESAGDFSFPVISLPVKDLPKRIGQLEAGFKHVVVDTPPGELAVVRSALMAVDQVVIPLPPSLMDIDRLRPTLELIAEVEGLSELKLHILLTRVRKGTKSLVAARTILGEFGLSVLEAEIPLREGYATAFGMAPTDPREYREALEQILGA